jgi:hypothetical protein
MRTYCSTVLCSLKAIQLSLSRCNWTFRDAIDTVHLIRSELPHAVPMDTSSINSQVVRHGDLERITPVCN